MLSLRPTAQSHWPYRLLGATYEDHQAAPRAARASYAFGDVRLDLRLSGPEGVRDADGAIVPSYNLSIVASRGGQPGSEGAAVYHLSGDWRVIRSETAACKPVDPCPFEVPSWDDRGELAPLGLGYPSVFLGSSLDPVPVRFAEPQATFVRVAYDAGAPLDPVPALRALVRDVPYGGQALFPGADDLLFPDGVSPKDMLDHLRLQSSAADAILAGGGCLGLLQVEAPSVASNPVQGIMYYTASQDFRVILLPQGAGVGKSWQVRWEKRWDGDDPMRLGGSREDYNVTGPFQPSGNDVPSGLTCQSIQAGLGTTVDAGDHLAQLQAMPWYEHDALGGFLFRYITLGSRNVPVYYGMFDRGDGQAASVDLTPIRSAADGQWVQMMVHPGDVPKVDSA
jgi:hypothetical protein